MFYPLIFYPTMNDKTLLREMPPKYRLSSDTPGTQILPVSLTLSKNFSYTHGREGVRPGGQRMSGRKGWTFWGQELGAEQHREEKAVGRRATEAPEDLHLLLSWFPSFKTKPVRWPWQDTDNKETFSALLFPFYIFFPQITLCPTPLPNVLNH